MPKTPIRHEITQLLIVVGWDNKGLRTILSKWKKGLGSRIIRDALAGKRLGIQIIGVI